MLTPKQLAEIEARAQHPLNKGSQTSDTILELIEESRAWRKMVEGLRLDRETMVLDAREACARIAEKGTVENGGISDWGTAGDGIAKAIRSSFPDSAPSRSQTLEEALRSIQWGSCDGCNHHRFCPECGAENRLTFDEPNADGLYEVEDNNALHKAGCKVGIALGRVAQG